MTTQGFGATVDDIATRALRDELTDLKCGKLLELMEGPQTPYKKSPHFKGQMRLTDAYLADGSSVIKQLPKHIQKITNALPREFCDVNCFRSALYWHFPNVPLKALTWIDFQAATFKNFDRLQGSDQVHLGDLLVYNQYDTHGYHAGILVGMGLTDYILWHKGSNDHRDPWTLEGLRDASRDYRSQGDFTLEIYRLKNKR